MPSALQKKMQKPLDPRVALVYGGCMNTTPTTAAARSPLGTQVARAMLAGDVHLARQLADGHTSWSVAELRGILGAGAAMTKRRWCDGHALALSILGWA